MNERCKNLGRNGKCEATFIQVIVINNESDVFEQFTQLPTRSYTDTFLGKQVVKCDAGGHISMMKTCSHYEPSEEQPD